MVSAIMPSPAAPAGEYQVSIVDSKSKGEVLPGSPFPLGIHPAAAVAARSAASFSAGVKKGVAVAGDPIAVTIALADKFGNATAAGEIPVLPPPSRSDHIQRVCKLESTVQGLMSKHHASPFAQVLRE